MEIEKKKKIAIGDLAKTFVESYKNQLNNQHKKSNSLHELMLFV